MNKLLHIYAQQQWHDNAFIIGDREGLEILREAIDKALQTDGPINANVFANDGEGYTVVILCTESHCEMVNAYWDKLAVPYTDEVAAEKNEDAIWPEMLVSQEHTFVEHPEQ
jgi:hypothetical protein